MTVGKREGSDRESDLRLLSLYLKEIGRISRLSPEEERETGERARKGDLRARRRLVESNLRLVVFAARRFVSGPVPLEDLIEEGNLGLIEAAERYDPAYGTRFSTYAFWKIRQKMLAYLETERKIRYISPCGDDAEGEEACREGGGGENGEDLLKLVAGDMIRESVERQIGLLPPDMRTVLELREGLNGCRRHSTEEIGQKLGMSRGRVEQLYRKALHRLRCQPEMLWAYELLTG